VGQAIFNEVRFVCYFAKLLAEVLRQTKTALWKLPRPGNGGKTKCRSSTVPTALGKLDQERRVSHSSHSPYG
jgi:hypothetical protein